MRGWACVKLAELKVFLCTKREGFNGTKFNLFEFGVKYLNFGATYLSLGATYLNFGAINLNFGAQIRKDLSKGMGGGGWVPQDL